MEFIPCKAPPKSSSSYGDAENDLPLTDRVRALETQNKLLSDQISFLTSLVATLQLQLNKPSGERASNDPVPTKSPKKSDFLGLIVKQEAKDELAEECDRLCASRYSNSDSSSPSSRPRETQGGGEEVPTPVLALLTKKREEARDKGYTAIVNGITSAVENAAENTTTSKTKSDVGREVALLNTNNALVVDSSVDRMALHRACSLVGGSVEACRLLLARGVSVTERDEEGKLALHHAACHTDDGYMMIAAILEAFEKKYAVNFQPPDMWIVNVEDVHGSTPLHYATRHKNLLAMKALVLRGADPNKMNNCFLSSRDIARSMGFSVMDESLGSAQGNARVPTESGLRPYNSQAQLPQETRLPFSSLPNPLPRAESLTSSHSRSEYHSDEDWHPEHGYPVAYFESYGSANGRPIYLGPRGGRFYFTSGGNKKYV